MNVGKIADYFVKQAWLVSNVELTLRDTYMTQKQSSRQEIPAVNEQCFDIF